MKKKFAGLMLFAGLLALIFVVSPRVTSVVASTIVNEGKASISLANVPDQEPLTALASTETTEIAQQDWWALLSQIAKARQSYILVTFTDRVMALQAYTEVQGFSPEMLFARYPGLDQELLLARKFYRVQLVHETEGSYVFAYTWDHQDAALEKLEPFGSINIHWEGQDPSVGFWLHLQLNDDGSFTKNPSIKIDMK